VAEPVTAIRRFGESQPEYMAVFFVTIVTIVTIAAA